MISVPILIPPGWFSSDLQLLFRGFWHGKSIYAYVQTRSKPSFPSKTNLNEGNLNAAAGGRVNRGKREESVGKRVESIEEESH